MLHSSTLLPQDCKGYTLLCQYTISFLTFESYMSGLYYQLDQSLNFG